MVRVKRGVNAHKKREKLLKYAKGFRWGRKSKERLAREALLHAWSYAFAGRKQKKRDYRAMWQSQINAGVRMHNMSYSKFIAALKKKNIELDRKILASLAADHPDTFTKVVEAVK